MQQLLRHQLWIVLAAGVVFFTNLGGAHLWDDDETLHATCAREMADRGDWVVPFVNGKLFPDKPPLMFWLMITGSKLFGMNELAVRFWSAVLGVGTALVTYHLGRLLFRAEVGLWAGLIVASTLIFTVSARAATVDSALVFASMLALLIFVNGATAGRGSVNGATTGRGFVLDNFLPGSWLSFVLMYAVIGVAVLAKGPVGLLLPVASLGLFLMVMNRVARQGADAKPRAAGRWTAWWAAMGVFSPRNVLRSAWQLRPVTALAVVAAVALPWYVLVGLRTEGAWLAQFLGEHNLQRAFRPFESHSGPFFYYLPAILIGFFPWSVFIAPTFLEVVRRIRRRDPWRTGLILLSCWSGLFLAFWSVVSTKLPHYVLPIYPPLALMTGVFLDVWLTEPSHYKPWWMRNAVVTLIAVGLGLLVAMPILARIFLPGEELLGLVGLILVIGGGWSLWHHYRQQRRRTLAAFAATSVAFLTAIFGFAAVRVDRHQNAPSLVAEIRQANPGPTQLAAYRYLKQSLVWYAEQPVPRCENPDELRQFLDTAENPCVFTNSEREAEIEKEFPGVFYVLARQRRFLRSGEVLVLARRPDRPAAHTAGRSAAGGRQ